MRIEDVWRGDTTEFTTVASAPLANRTTAMDTSSVSVSRACRPAIAVTSVHGPSSASKRSNWWMPWPIVGPPPSTSHRPRHGTAK
jgi:hypothetical protein